MAKAGNEQVFVHSKDRTHHKILIIGGGTAALSVAAQLRLKGESDIAIIKPSGQHFYQAAWTLVGAGACSVAATVREEEPVRWIQDHTKEIYPKQQTVITRSGQQIGYNFLAVAPGIQLDWHKVGVLEETLGKNGVSSNYHFDLSPKTCEFLQQFKGGTALFTALSTPIKYGGAPQNHVPHRRLCPPQRARRRHPGVFCSAGTPPSQSSTPRRSAMACDCSRSTRCR